MTKTCQSGWTDLSGCPPGLCSTPMPEPVTPLALVKRAVCLSEFPLAITPITTEKLRVESGLAAVGHSTELPFDCIVVYTKLTCVLVPAAAPDFNMNSERASKRKEERDTCWDTGWCGTRASAQQTFPPWTSLQHPMFGPFLGERARHAEKRPRRGPLSFLVFKKWGSACRESNSNSFGRNTLSISSKTPLAIAPATALTFFERDAFRRECTAVASGAATDSAARAALPAATMLRSKKCSTRIRSSLRTAGHQLTRISSASTSRGARLR